MGLQFTNFDKTKVYFGDDYEVSETISIHQPTIKEIIDYGEKEYFSMVSTLCSIPSDMMWVLWEKGIDWNKLSDFEFFCYLIRGYSVETTRILFGKIDFSKMETKIKEDTGEVFLISEDQGLIIDEFLYHHMIDYVRFVHGIKPKPQKAINRTTKEAMLMEAQTNYLTNQSKEYSPILFPLISSMMLYPGFKYKKNELREVGIFEFMDAVKRAQIIVSTTALLGGMYSGMVDTSKIPQDQFNWMRNDRAK